MLNRAISSIRKRKARLSWPNGRGIVRRDGVLYLINLNSGIWYDKQILQLGLPDKEQLAYLVDNIRRKNCDAFLDVGANFGLYATYVAMHTDCADIRAYEPDSRSHDKLRANLLINGLTRRVQTRMVAVSDHNGQVPYKLGPVDDDTSSEVSQDGDTGYTVPSVRLDDDFPVNGRRIAFKIDIQFHELIALQGMKNLLRDNDCFLQVELMGDYIDPFIAAMEEEGYVLKNQIRIDYYFEKRSIAAVNAN
jgi:FkbM family methyltransferase